MKYFRVFGCFLVAVAVLCVFACTKTEPVWHEATKYGVVYDHYVLAAEVKLKDGNIAVVEFEEAEAPYSWARVSNIATELDEGDVVTNEEYTGSGDSRAYAKRIKIAGVVFEARNNGESKNYVDYFNAGKNGETPFELWLAGSDNARWYFESITSGDYDVVKADGTAANVEFKAASSGELPKSARWLKSKNGYWQSSETRKGWQGNMNAMSDYIIAHGFADYEAQRDTLEPEGEEIVIGGVKTGATVIFFKDYMDLANEAYKEAVAKMEAQSQKETKANLFVVAITA